MLGSTIPSRACLFSGHADSCFPPAGVPSPLGRRNARREPVRKVVNQHELLEIILKYSVSGAGIIAEIVDFVFQTNRTSASADTAHSAVPTFATGFWLCMKIKASIE